MLSMPLERRRRSCCNSGSFERGRCIECRTYSNLGLIHDFGSNNIKLEFNINGSEKGQNLAQAKTVGPQNWMRGRYNRWACRCS